MAIVQFRRFSTVSKNAGGRRRNKTYLRSLVFLEEEGRGFRYVCFSTNFRLSLKKMEARGVRRPDSPRNPPKWGAPVTFYLPDFQGNGSSREFCTPGCLMTNKAAPSARIVRGGPWLSINWLCQNRLAAFSGGFFFFHVRAEGGEREPFGRNYGALSLLSTVFSAGGRNSKEIVSQRGVTRRERKEESPLGGNCGAVSPLRTDCLVSGKLRWQVSGG